MSEFLAGMPELPPAKPPRDSAVVILFRRVQLDWSPDVPGNGLAMGTEVFWIKREQKLAFAGGFYAFPGGKVDSEDATVPVQGATGIEAQLRATAARELLEETGVLMARGAQTLLPAQIDAMRHALLDGQAVWGELLAAHGLHLHADDFHDAGRWLTPAFMPVRFDARFYVVEAPATSNAVVWPGELSEGEWVAPTAALARWAEGTALLHPPNLFALETMKRHATWEATLQTLRAPPHTPNFIAERLEFQQGIRMVPLRTPTLPPATHTNCYLLGTTDLLIVDPGTPDEEELSVLVRQLKQYQAEGLKLHGILLTHHHGDHIGGLASLAHQLKLPVFAHPLTADRLPVKTDVLVNDGDLIDLPNMPWRALHTPGHARGHLTLVHEPSRAAIVGDMVAGIGTIVIDPPEGNMGEYLRQLKRLHDLPVRAIYPAHGSPLPDGPAKLAEYAAHRAWREAKVIAALEGVGLTVDQLVAKAYDDVAAFVHPLAERNTVAILGKLVEERRAENRDGRYFLRS